METAKNRKIGALIYEFLGTAFMTYGVMVLSGLVSFPLTFAMLVLAWEVSGGHFNPAITLGMWVASSGRGKNLVTMLLMIAGQVCGAFFGVLLGYLAIVDKTYQNAKALADAQGIQENVQPVDSWVPTTFFNFNVPYKVVGEIIFDQPQSSRTEDVGPDFTQNWSCFFGILMASIVLVFGYISIKSPKTRLHDDKLVGAFLIAYLVTLIESLSFKFGRLGANPAIATAYILFTESQKNFPNFATNAIDNSMINHYLWVYTIAPMAGGFIGGVLHLIHSKCSKKDGKSDGHHVNLPTEE